MRINTRAKSGFTLIELLIVIGIVAILAAVVILILNPAEFLKQARDGRRLSELRTLDKAVAFFNVDSGGNASLGAANTVYVSLPDPTIVSPATSNCASLGLPPLPPAWTYACVSAQNLQNINGTGWIPLDLTGIPSGQPLSHLPIDPVNTSTSLRYYTYVTSNGNWEVTGFLESEKHRPIAIEDGGSLVGVFEVGSRIQITPPTRDAGLVASWRFEENVSGNTYDSSGHNYTGTLVDHAALTVNGKRGNALLLDGSGDYANMGDVNEMDGVQGATMLAWAYFDDPSFDTPADDFESVVAKFNDFDDRFGMTMSGNLYGSTNEGYLLLGNDGAGINNYSYTNTDVIVQQVWQHWAMVFDGSKSTNNEKLKFYLDGMSRNLTHAAFTSPPAWTPTSPNFPNVTPDSSAPVKVGVENLAAPHWWDGYIDEVRIYDRALSDAEVKAIYRATK